MHECINKYQCNQFEFQVAMKGSLKIHQASLQDKVGLQYASDNCELLSKTKQYLVSRKKDKTWQF